MRTIRSQGGPLILMSRGVLHAWQGNQSRRDRDRTDYDRARAARGHYIQPIDVFDQQALVLTDEPIPASILRDPATPERLLVIRWLANDFMNPAAEDVLKSQEEVPFTSNGIRWRVTGPQVVLFDANLSGADLPAKIPSAATAVWEVSIAPGEYEVSTAFWGLPGGRDRILLHRLERAG